MVPGMFRHLLLAFLSSFLIHAQDQPGFINIDCGLPENYSYPENETGLAYTSDAAFIDTGISMSVSPEFVSDNLWQPLKHVRSFPQGIRNCYNIELSRGNKYLIRANFFYGNYDLQRRVPEFELHLGANLWDIVRLPDASTWIVPEIIHVPSSNSLSLCLVNTGFGTPFISAIELRPLRNIIYEIQSGSLERYWRYDIASSTNQIFRYKIDEYDRTWWPWNYEAWDQLNSSLSIDSRNNDFKPPSVIMGTAAVPKNNSMPLSLILQARNQTNKFYVYMYFAEVEKLQANQFRQFNISLNGQHWSGPHSPAYLEASTVYKTSPLTGQLEYEFLIHKARNSSLPPIINAIEVYKVNELPQLQTNQDDVDAVKNIQSTYKIKRNWQGDACAPEAYLWNGLNCSYNDSPRIISMNLSSSGLTGNIAPYISNLSMLQFLDLSNNSLVGEVPGFLSKLPLLRVLNLKKNKLVGSVPVELILRSKDGSLILSVSGNPDLCSSISCNNKDTKVVAPVAASVTTSFVLISALAVFLYFKRRKQQGKTDGEFHRANAELESKNRLFTYFEVMRITNNLDRILGKGKHGTVYHGYLDGTPVAVKMLSSSSVQSYKHFQAEVKLLLGVHHRNLINLVGYCNEGGLIYEYMANGSLEELLLDSSKHFLNWEGRLRVALAAAQGLEYLHKYCKPTMVHGNVKPSNILINDEFQVKLADFGLSGTFPNDEGTFLTSAAGTSGYPGHEYSDSKRLSEKTDVYSFGIVLLEMFTGQPAISRTSEKAHKDLVERLSYMLAKGDIEKIVDPRLKGNFGTQSVRKALEIAMACISAAGTGRLTMDVVAMELNQCLAVEIAQNKKDHESKAKGSIEMITVNLDDDESILLGR
ncbi:PREDICTED: putative leucine-rich repeat receptor-like serine/threonine-protein kinase At2g19230 isoform X2 [Theobroma cacao]|uniref:Leucine-rich repeat receptor-like serine/threonine-protein kinase At2g19230 isoform X2 n=1 Tax=Theobroma cacao TaxID=3641 RepID=A0AB32V0G9_THECC|nr:PREDICTED: putative leucine-rich repeat receptor-like serine/threonine-protein kinase At2g19230 isoform X2 [Theobroma cacao]